jgi:hypothetical protein
MTTKAIGDGPIVFFNNLGQQTVLPLSEISFDGLTPYVDPAIRTDRLMTRLTYLAKQGQLHPDTAPPPPTAMVVTAANLGSTGNNISVSFKPNAANTTVDVFVVEEDTYVGLTMGNIELTLGRATAGSRPGVVKLKTALAPTPPEPVENPNILPDASSGGGPPPATPTFTVLGVATGGGPAPTAFVLEARGQTNGTMTVAITNVSAGPSPKTFTLTAKWTSPTVTLSAQDFAEPAKIAPLTFAVRFAPPTVGGNFSLPGETLVHLSGGSESAVSNRATATVSTGS